MKAGTTSLYNDLYRHPDIYLPEQKEPELLLSANSDDRVRRMYRKLMKGATPGTIKGEASTGYTKRPQSEGCAARALRILGSDTKFIYIERDPIERAISHYRHCVIEGTETRCIDEALIRSPEYVDYGRYQWQLEPWLSLFGPNQICVLSFEEYVENRDGFLRSVADFLRVDPQPLLGFSAEIHNSSDNKLVASRWQAAAIDSQFFQTTLKRLVPRRFRRALKPLFLKTAPKTAKTIRPETEKILAKRLAQSP